MSFLVRGAAAGIGMASEGYQNHKEKRAAKKAAKEGNAEEVSSDAGSSIAQQPDGHDGESDLESTLNELDLDEAQNDIEKPTLDPKKIGFADVSKLAAQFAAAHPPITLVEGEKSAPLDYAVVLPQRRPNKRARGFIHAYAPILEAKAIDEETFLSFIEMFNYASQASPLLDAINLAQLATVNMAPGIGIPISIAIQIAVDTTVELTSRHRTNEFLDRMNQYFFRPRGLYCMVMTWRPQSSAFRTPVDISVRAEKQAERSEGGSRNFFGRFSSSSGTSHGNFPFPKCAPLVFPGLNSLALADQQELESSKKPSKLAGVSESMAEYRDRRARAKYAMRNPNAQLAQLGERPQFKSRYADPTHPAARGSLLGLLTGGAITIGDKADAQESYSRAHSGSVFTTAATMLDPTLGLRHAKIGGTLFEKKDKSVEEGVDKSAGKYSGQYGGMFKDVANKHDEATKNLPNMNILGAIEPVNIFKMMTGRETLYLAIVDLPSKDQLQQATEIMAKADPDHAEQYTGIDVTAATSQAAPDLPDEYLVEPSDRVESQAAFARQFEEAYGATSTPESLAHDPSHPELEPPRYELMSSSDQPRLARE